MTTELSPGNVRLNDGLEPARYACGQKLYFEWSKYSSKRNTGEMVTITKIGRRWLELSNGHRADAATLCADGGKYSAPGRCYLSREAREADRAREAAWTALSHKMQRRAPGKVSAEDIAHATLLLGL